MFKQRNGLPQLAGKLFLTDGGLETTLIFKEGFDLPEFAAFTLLEHEAGRAAMRNYYRKYAAIARAHEVGFILESATWRASSAWGNKLGYSAEQLADANHKAVDLMREIKAEFETEHTPVVLSGCIGSRDDGYNPTATMTEREAERYHAHQVVTLGNAGVDMITALTMSNVEEAIGLTRAARFAGIPVSISFTVETDGRLPTGQALGEAIKQVDASTGDAPAYYMINCAHPTHFRGVLVEGEAWIDRVRGLRPNASSLSHAELDGAEELDDGDPLEIGVQCGELAGVLRKLNVLGGCCGTDDRHIEEICKAWQARN